MATFSRQNKFVLTLAVVALVALAGPLGAESARIKRQSGSGSGTLNLTSVISALNLTSYLQGANTQITQAIANLTAELQSQAPAIQQAAQQALQGLSNNTQNLATNLEQYLVNFESQLNSTGTTVSANLTNSINTLETFYNQSAPALQQLINAVGANITNATQTLQADIAALNSFLQSGLGNLTSFSSSSVQQSITSLENSLNSGSLNQTLATLVTEFNGQTINFQTALNALQQQAGPSFQSAFNNIQNGMNAFMLFFETLFQAFFQNSTLLVSPS